MKPLTFLGNLVLWALVALISAVLVWAALQPYRVINLFQNIAALSGPSKDQVMPFEGLLLRIPKQVAGCGSVGWVKTLVEAKAILVDGLCNISVAPEFAGSGPVVGGSAEPADCHEFKTATVSHLSNAKSSTHFCVYSARIVSIDDFATSGGPDLATARVFFTLGGFSPFAKIDQRLVLESNPGDRYAPLNEIAQKGIAYGDDDEIKVLNQGGFDWVVVNRKLRFIRDVQ